MGAALWHQFTGSEEGFNLWLEWSQADVEGYHGQTVKKMQAKWKSFDWRKKNRRPLTFATVMKQVNEGLVDDIEPSLLGKYLDRFALLPNDRIVDLEGHARSQKDYNGLSKTGIEYLCPNDYYKPPDSKKRRHMVNKWLSQSDKQMLAGFEYSIGSDHVFEAEGVNWLNMYIPPSFPETEDTDMLDQLKEHIDYLFPNHKDRDLFLAMDGTQGTVPSG